MNEKISAVISIILCSVFGVCEISDAKIGSTQSNDRALQKSIVRQGMVWIPKFGIIRLADPIYPGSHFTWNEATRYGTRIPRDTWYRGELISAQNICLNIVELAKELDLIRLQFGNNPIDINSFYRPPEVNNRTPGAAKDSYHLIGLAADFVVRNRSAALVYRNLDAEWEGGLGRYSNRTHIDRRDLLGDDSARW